LGVLKARGKVASRAGFTFGHLREYEMGAGLPVLVASYHPSQQNTSTGKLTEEMLVGVFERARELAG
jgi:uracil-DNA glycosylase